MNCADVEILICDYVDGALGGRSEGRRWNATWASVRRAPNWRAIRPPAVAFMGRAEEVEPPPELITRILFDAPWSKGKARPRRGASGRTPR